jgi:hypothetical protein
LGDLLGQPVLQLCLQSATVHDSFAMARSLAAGVVAAGSHVAVPVSLVRGSPDVSPTFRHRNATYSVRDHEASGEGGRVRRLAKQTRDDVYLSLRDYQELHTARGQHFHPRVPGDHRLTFQAEAYDVTNTAFVGAGVYLRPSQSVRITLELSAGGTASQITAELGAGHWNRVGVALQASEVNAIRMVLRWSGAADLDVWGLSVGPLQLPDALLSAISSVRELNQTHLAPETFYLIQDVAVGMDLVEGESTPVAETPGAEVTLKKCSYCQRMLPLDPARLGTLAFHKHNAKKTKHQNECRACKKWRINDSFNPKRTVDQLHESSVITRERKLFLREPERLQEYKERTGAGLKSQVWNRFDRKCFYCDKPLELSEVQLDHTRPLAYLWPIDEHATCLCAEHNNQKTDKFPVDFYNDRQLRRLAEITGLPYAQLVAKQINAAELARIRDNIVEFAEEWEPRTFAATARKVVEMLPSVDLFEDLRAADPVVSRWLEAALTERPLGVEDDS